MPSRFPRKLRPVKLNLSLSICETERLDQRRLHEGASSRAGLARTYFLRAIKDGLAPEFPKEDTEPLRVPVATKITADDEQLLRAIAEMYGLTGSPQAARGLILAWLNKGNPPLHPDRDVAGPQATKERTFIMPQAIASKEADAGAFVPDWLVRRKEVSTGTAMLYGRLLCCAGESGVARVTIGELAKSLGLGQRQTQIYLRRLQDLGLLSKGVPGATAGDPWSYHFPPHPWMEFADPDAPIQFMDQSGQGGASGVA